MTKQEILPVVKKMLADYLEIAKHENEIDVIINNPLFNRGFCAYIYRKAFPSVDYNDILLEMFTDYVPVYEHWNAKFPLKSYWYPPLMDFYFVEFDKAKPFDFQHTIQPRIDHLKRTITRLEQSTLNP